MIVQEAYLEWRQLLAGVDLKDGAGLERGLTLEATHTSNEAHEIVFPHKYYCMRMGKMITSDQSIMTDFCGREGGQERMLIRGLAAT